MSESESDSEFVRTSSVKGYESVPRAEEFKIKFKPWNGKSKAVLYTLKEGQNLPYSPVLEGYDVQFGKDLKPSMDSAWTCEKKQDVWVFKESNPENRSLTLSPLQSPQPTTSFDLSETPVITPPPAVSPRSLVFGTESVDHQATSDTVLDISLDENVPGMTEEELIMGLFEKSDNDLEPEFKCTLCGYASEWQLSSLKHMKEKHRQWRDLVSGNTVSEDTVVSQSSTETKFSPGTTVHTNPNWIDEFKTDFFDLVVAKCSEITRDAFEKNSDIKDLRSKKQVRCELIDAVITHVFKVWGGVGIPRLAVMREVATTMAIKYPKMFEDVKSLSDSPLAYYGLGGKMGNKYLDKHLVDRFRVRDRESKKRSSTGNIEDEEQAKKRGKRKDIYGVDSRKWHEGKSSKESIEAIKKASEEQSFETREATFAKHREALQHQISTSSKEIHKICRGFFSDPGHLAAHFEWLSNVPSLNETVEKNLLRQLDLMLDYLKHVDRTIGFKEKLDKIDLEVETDYGASRTYRDIHILRELGSKFDKDGSSLLKLEKELPASDGSPFILACEFDRNWVFEVWVEGKKLFGNLSLSIAMATFLHLAFVFDLKYPKDAQTLADIIQRRIARYGSDDGVGTRTSSGKTTALSKYSKYLQVLGEIRE